jgi:hypothetical protein
MLVALFNAVKVESVPLKFNFFAELIHRAARPSRPAEGPTPARRPSVEAIFGKAWAMSWDARNGLFVVFGALAVAVAMVAALILLTTRPAPAATDEDQVRSVLERMNGSYNRSDFDAFASHVCTDMLRADAYKAGWYQSRQSDGPTEITVNSIDVTGGPHPRAVANVRFVAANHADPKTLDIDFLRDGAEWKACRYVAGQSV